MRPSAVRRSLYFLASFVPAWAIIAGLTGGVGTAIGPLRLSSRDPWRPAIVGLALWGYYLWRYRREERASDGVWLEASLKRALPVLAILAVAIGFIVGVRYGSFAAAGSDSYGYVSQAQLWRQGTLHLSHPLIERVTWPDREWVFSPLGYRPSEGRVVPTYPPGLPIVMAGLLALVGENGPFYVVPILGALLIAFTFLIGREASGSVAVATIASLFMVTSPTFLTHVMVPTSDVPAAAGWTLVAFFALREGTGRRALLAGIVAGVTLLIRPNLVLLALVPVVAWHSKAEVLVRYTWGIAPSLIAITFLNTHLYGAPLTFGYGRLLESYALGAAPQNLSNYTRWLFQTQTPLVVLAAIPLAVGSAIAPRAKGCLGAVLGLTLFSYLFYGSFDNWFYLRFLLPAYPALFVLMAAGLCALSVKLPREARVPAVLCVCAALIPLSVRVGSDAYIFNQAAFERRHVHAAEAVAVRTPPDAAVLAVQHSGSVRYYANRVTLRFDWLPADRLDAILAELTALGYHPFLLVDDWEEKDFRTRFGANGQAGRLDWDPIARVHDGPQVRLYDLAGREAPSGQ